MIEIGQAKSSSVFHEIHANYSGDIGKNSVAIIGIKNISLVAAPGAIGSNQFIDCIPSLLVRLGSASFVGRARHYLSPEKTV